MSASPRHCLCCRGAALLSTLLVTACAGRPTPNPNVVVVGITSGPNNLDPRFDINDSSQKIHQLIFDSLLILDDRLRVVTTGGLAERFDHPDSTTYIDYQHVG